MWYAHREFWYSHDCAPLKDVRTAYGPIPPPEHVEENLGAEQEKGLLFQSRVFPMGDKW